MASVNKVILIGNLTAAPELKQTPNGVSVASFRIAVQRRTTDKDGQRAADFINIVAWRQNAEFICRYFSKGDPICIIGAIQSRTWTATDGQKRYITEVVADEALFVGCRSDKASAAADSDTQYDGTIYDIGDTDSSLPF